MRKPRGRVLIVLAGLAVALGTAATCRPSSEDQQPIAYNHRIHTQDQGLSCDTCHQQATTGERAGRPSITVCLQCHETALTENPDVEKIRSYAAAGEEIPWVRITRVADHVYFSHRRHVVAAAIECATCHGPMETQTAPPKRPLKPIRMSMCMDCHQKSDASLDCNACHR